MRMKALAMLLVWRRSFIGYYRHLASAAYTTGSELSKTFDLAIQFSSTVDVRSIPPLKDFPPQISRLAGTRMANINEYEENVSNRYFDGKGVDFKDKTYCSSRGLESYTSSAAVSKTKTRKANFDVVLTAQKDQWSLGINDQEVVSQRYIDASFSC